MGIYRGAGGTGDAVNDASSEALLTVQAKDAALAAQAAAEAAQAAAELAETNAETAETNAETAETNAETAETNAETAATNAASSASAASTSASNAASSASAASTSASNASTSATNASNSASAASTSATNAANSASAASTSATNAASSATSASGSASAASTSATNASNSASAAATSATNASNSASAASTSATNAASSATSAAGSATTATTQATNASNSASAASTSATNASNSASAASTSATNASNSASAASTSATNASNSASAAATSATNAAASYDSFDDRYLGAKSSAPSVDNDGNTLLVGALYYDTVSSSMKVWSGSAWLDAYASLSGALLATNNLSDLNNTATARTNLGVAIGTNVQAWDADLDTWATKTAPSGTVVGTSDSQTLTNKTLTTPVISSISNTGTLTLPTSTDTLVGRATTDTLTNKTIALGSNTVSGTLAEFNTAVTDADLVSIAGSETLTNKTLTSPTINTATITGGSINNTPIGATTANTGAFTTLSATGVTTVQAGTVSAPAITTSGDTNTGIFFPAADTIAFAEGGVESMRIDSSGNVGIGTTSPTTKLHVQSSSTGYNTGLMVTSGSAQIGAFVYTGTSTVNIASEYLGAGSYYPLAFLTGGSERMRIDSSGNVGIGTSSPSFSVDVVRSGGDAQLRLMSQATGTNGIIFRNNAAPTSAKGAILYPNGSAVGGDTMQFVVDAAERMRIDINGNVGIGTSSPSYRLHAVSSAAVVSRLGSSGGSGAFLNFIDSGASPSNAPSVGAIGNNLVFMGDGSSTERMRITSSGDVLVGGTTSTTLVSFQVQTGNTSLSNAGFQILNSTTGTGGLYYGDSTSDAGRYAGYIEYGHSINAMQFATNTTERMRIDSSGRLLVGTTAENPGYGNTNTGQQLGATSVSCFSRAAADWVITCNQNTVDGSTYYQMQFRVSDVSKGSITSTSSATAYNTSSDYRLKENIAPMTGALSTIKALKPVTYNWKVDGANGQGFIAHELQAVVPECVTGEKDAINADGTIKPQQMDTSFLVATLTAAIQEQQALIENLTTRLNALEGK